MECKHQERRLIGWGAGRDPRILEGFIHSVARPREVWLSRAGAEAFEMMILDDDVISAHI